ncbi:hypothetical protein BLA29_013924 [Euroglyphus maynei]|uniref:Uncharacterized protein n=1 Tax=Euroglyphus maynei TaxID=6958 RepID=A0A1Y3B2T9_EURMA|nr:hypothetical protein BLA29_013924 [Euroglyphus maynei]
MSCRITRDKFYISRID